MGIDGKRARRIAVISGKGGVGKTIITANLAANLSAGGHRILAVDADLGLANLDLVLGIMPQTTILEVMRGLHPLDKLLVHVEEGFDLLPAGSGLPEGTVLTQALIEGIESIIKSIENQYDIILFDAGAGVGDVVLFFANLADEILLVVTPEPTSVMDSYATIKILNQLHGKREFLMVVNQANPESLNQIGAAVVRHLQKVISQFIDKEDKEPVHLDLIGSIPVDPAVPQAVRQRQLLVETSPDAPSAFLLNRLADTLRARIVCQ
jgi:flagellar biosynthesis protein FlhG